MKTLLLIMIPMMTFSSVFLVLDTRNGISLGYDMGDLKMYTGYRFTGLEYESGIGPLKFGIGTFLDPFSMEAGVRGTTGLDFDFLNVDLFGSFTYWDVSSATEMTQSGIFEAGISLGLKMGSFKLGTFLSFSPIALVYYPEEEEMKFHFLYPPINPSDVVMNSHVVLDFGLDFGSFDASIGYEMRFGFVAGVPGPLIDMRGIFLKVRMRSEIPDIR